MIVGDETMTASHLLTSVTLSLCRGDLCQTEVLNGGVGGEMDFLQRFLGKPKGPAPVGNITLSELDINPRTCSFKLLDIQNLCFDGSHKDLELQAYY